MDIIIFNAQKNINTGIVEIPKNASSLFGKIMYYRRLRSTRTIRKSMAEFLQSGHVPGGAQGLDSSKLRSRGFNKRNKFTVVVYLRDPYKRFLSGLYEELCNEFTESRRWEKIDPNRPSLTMKMLEENFADLDFTNIDHTILQCTKVDLTLKYCNYDFFYDPESLGVIVEKYNICKADELWLVNSAACDHCKVYFANWIHETGILEKNKNIIYRYLQPDYDLLNFIKTKWGFSYGRYN